MELNTEQHFNNDTYPTIDHKISIFYGFKNNILPRIIGGFDNLCICSRLSNTKKNIMNENEFKNKNNI